MKHKTSSIICLYLILTILISVLANAADFKIEVDEGELVKLNLNANDPDGDDLTYICKEPLDENCEWQTGFNDAGTYNVDVIASDGESESTSVVEIVVNNVNRKLDLGATNFYEVTETETFSLELFKLDDDGDEIIYDISEPVGDDGIWETGFNDAGEYDITIKANDGKDITEKTIKLKVNEKDRAPELNGGTQFEINEGETFKLMLEERDIDGDGINYKIISLPEGAYVEGFEIMWETHFDTVKPNYNFVDKLFKNSKTDSEQTFDFDIVAESNGLETSQKYIVIVNNVNRAPIIESQDEFIVKEGKSYLINANIYDLDGDPLKITYSGDVENKRITPKYDESGEYVFSIIASDGNLQTEKKAKLVVLNNNRIPKLEKKTFVVKENEESNIILKYKDPDNENVKITDLDLPEGVEFEKDTISLKPTYDFIEHSEENAPNIIIKGINYLFRTKFYQKEIDAKFGLDDSNNKTTEDVKIIIKDVNRAPIINPARKIIVSEGENMYILVSAEDPDKDKLYYSFKEENQEGSRFRFRWNNRTIKYDSQGMHNVSVSVSDGVSKTTIKVPIEVIDVNRGPKIDIRNYSVSENDTIMIPINVIDEDGDNFTISLSEDIDGMWIVNNTLNYNPSFDMSSSDSNNDVIYNIKAVDNRGAESVIERKINVANVNRAPLIRSFSPNSKFWARIGESVEFKVDAYDPDGDELTYVWEVKEGNIVDDNIHTRLLNSPGLSEIKVVAKDRFGLEVSQEWQYIVRVPKQSK